MMKELSTKMVRVSPGVKARLESLKGRDTINACIEQMLSYFEQTGCNPGQAYRNPTARMEKRIEDLIKIVKSQERDLFKPMYTRMMESPAGIQDFPDYDALVNELNKCKQENARLLARMDREPDMSSGQERIRELVGMIEYNCDPAKFSKAKNGNDLIVPANFFSKFIETIKKEYVL